MKTKYKTIEQKIKEIVLTYNKAIPEEEYQGIKPFYLWRLENKPTYTPDQLESLAHTDDLIARVEKAIYDAPTSECLTSSSEYIRGCKKWFLEYGK